MRSMLIIFVLSAFTLAAAEKRPNIVFFLSDDHAFQALGSCEKDSPIPYPHLNRLAREGMVFDRSYCANSLCGPSRACILTGRHSHRNAFLYNGGPAFDGSQPTYPKMLKAAGYETAYIGKWHLDSDPTGFSHWNILTGQGCYYQPDFLSPDPKTGKRRRERVPGYVSDIITDRALAWLKRRDASKPFALVVAHKAPHRPWLPAIRHLGRARARVAAMTPPETLFDDYANRTPLLKQNRQRIFKDFSAWYDTHFLPPGFFKKPENAALLREALGIEDVSPYTLPPDFIRTFRPVRGQIGLGELDSRMDRAQRKAWIAYHAVRTKELADAVKSGRVSTQREMTVRSWRAYMEGYLETILGVDESVGRVLDFLDKNGLAKNTLVVYCGDQGFYLGEHGMFDKRWIFEESFRMPLVMRWPGRIPAGARSAAMVQNIDYAPTFCEVAGVSDPAALASMQGKSLVPLFRTGDDPAFRDRPLYYAYYENGGEHNAPRQDGFRTRRYTFARFPATGEWMLIDNEKDPLQLRNVIGDPAYAAAVPGLKALYRSLRETYKMPDALPGANTKGRKDFSGIKPSWDKPRE